MAISRARRHVSAYLDGELDADKWSVVEAHLETCPRCPPLYSGLAGVKANLGGVRDPDTVLDEAIAGRIRQQREHAATPRVALSSGTLTGWMREHLKVSVVA